VGVCPLFNGVARHRNEGSLVPTGVAFRDAPGQLFAAAERVLLRDGPNALTSRAVTTEAGCAKGVLHRHFADFDAFLAELVLDRIRRIEAQAAALRAAAGTGTVAANLTGVLMDLFGSVAQSIVALIISRDGLRARLRETIPAGIPLLTEAAAMIASYLAAERDLGRIGADVDVETAALTLIGTGHLLFAGLADRDGGQSNAETVHKTVMSVIEGRQPGQLWMAVPDHAAEETDSWPPTEGLPHREDEITNVGPGEGQSLRPGS
jgi:AcrR family transcriptional regulator